MVSERLQKRLGAGGSGTVPIGNNTAKACLTLDTGNSLPGGAVTVPASCEITYPVLCQRQPNKDALEPQQEEKKEQHCGCQCDHCPNEHGDKSHHHHRRRRASSDEQSTSSDDELVPRRNTSLIGSEHEHHRPDKAIKQDESNDDDSTEEEDSGKEPEDGDSNSVEDKKGIAKVTGAKDTTVVKGKLDEKKKQPVTLQAKQITAQKQKTDGKKAISPLAKRGFEEDLQQHGRKGKRDWQRINQGLVEYKQKTKDQGRKHPHGPVSMGTVAKSNNRLIAVNQGLVKQEKEEAKLIGIPHPHF